MKVNINNEYDKLKSVVVSSAEYYDPNTLALNNETIKYYALKGNVPTKEDILKEQKEFWQVLKNYGIKLFIAESVPHAKGAMFTRDLAFVIGNNFFISSMRKENRRPAIIGWEKIINDINPQNVIKINSNLFLEGGDVLVDGNTIFVGISERTTIESVKYLKESLGNEYEVIPLYLKPKFLHLDVVFTIINPNLALIYKDGFEKSSLELLKKYKMIELTEKEQFQLGTNVFVLDRKTIIVNSKHERIISEIKKHDLDVIEIDFSETAKDGGAFRCTTCPLERE